MKKRANSIFSLLKLGLLILPSSFIFPVMHRSPICDEKISGSSSYREDEAHFSLRPVEGSFVSAHIEQRDLNKMTPDEILLSAAPVTPKFASS